VTAGPTAPLRRIDAESGTATLVLPLLVWFAALVALFAIDLGAYLVAASRAQALADAAALAAIGSGVADGTRTPAGAAGRLVTAGGGRLERCDCDGARANVVVSMPVPGLLAPRLGAPSVSARAEARLVR
jgi:hypothetical protein